MAARFVSNAINLAHANQQLVDQVARLKTTVSELDAEIARNRETIAVQGKRILEQDATLAVLCDQVIGEQTSTAERTDEALVRAVGRMVRELQARRAAHRTIDPRPVYVLVDEMTTEVLRSEAAALALPDYDDDRR